MLSNLGGWLQTQLCVCVCGDRLDAHRVSGDPKSDQASDWTQPALGKPAGNGLQGRAANRLDPCKGAVMTGTGGSVC